MLEIGQALRRQRESSGMDLQEVERRTKIRRRYLEALESGDWSVLPGDVYARGFVRAYAECVGLDGFKLLEQYIDQPQAELNLDEGKKATSHSPPADAAQPEQAGNSGQEQHTVQNQDRKAPIVEGSTDPTADPRDTMQSEKNGDPAGRSVRTTPARSTNGLPYSPSSAARTSRPSSYHANNGRTRKTRNAVGQGLAVVIAFAVIAGAWWVLQKGHQGTPSPTATVNGSSLNSGQASNNAGSSVNGTSNGTGNGTNASNVVTNSAGTSANHAASVTAQPFDAGQGTLTVLVSAKDALVVSATASGGQCWVEVLADGKTIDGSDFVVPGNVKTWHGLQEVRIRLGAVPVVSLKVNGSAVKLPAVNYPIWVIVKKSKST